MDKIIEWSEGNPGALTFLIECIKSEDALASTLIMTKIETYKDIRGWKLYVLWSDLCNKDMEKVFQLITKCPKKLLEDACSKQDRSGLKQIEIYIN